MIKEAIIVGIIGIILAYFIVTNSISSDLVRKQILENVQGLANDTKNGITTLQGYVLQSRIESAQNTENQRTMFIYLDDIQEQLKNITNILENISSSK